MSFCFRLKEISLHTEKPINICVPNLNTVNFEIVHKNELYIADIGLTTSPELLDTNILLGSARRLTGM
jgi:hypothetical protein